MTTTYPSKYTEFVEQVINQLWGEHKLNKRQLEKMGRTLGINDQNKIKELTEYALVLTAREIVQNQHLTTAHQRFAELVKLYKQQPNLSHRNSTTYQLQQYSTPAPISYLAGWFTAQPSTKKVLEPSAGNGMLSIAFEPSIVTVNEIDELRRQNLENQPFGKVTAADASISLHSVGMFDAVLTNPPFGALMQAQPVEGYPLEKLEHVMAALALFQMNASGRAAIIIGGHTSWDKAGRITRGPDRVFFNYLYNKYNVVDVIPINGRQLYSRQGTSFNTRLVLIAGRKHTPKGNAPLKTQALADTVSSWETLYDRIQAARQEASILQAHTANQPDKAAQLQAAREVALRIIAIQQRRNNASELGAPYQPLSNGCVVLDTEVPDSMSFEMHQALERVRKAVGGSLDAFVQQRLGYKDHISLCKALAAEQIDAVATAIYQIEAKGQGAIIGDQTGIGKGRVAASMIRYAVEDGKVPIFITEKPNLFSDLYRDMVAIGSGHLRPFIVNERESKSHIKDENGQVIYQAPAKADQKAVFKSGELPEGFDYLYIVATYSQFSSPKRLPRKPGWLKQVAQNTILVLDESHNASGSGNTGRLLREVLAKAAGVTYLSATYAKRPDNMPVYAVKTAMADASMTDEKLVGAIERGGLALQEVISAQLVAEGQLVRRERSFKGVKVNYLYLDEDEAHHNAVSDNITEIMRGIISFQANHIDPLVNELDKQLAAEQKEAEHRKGNHNLGVDNKPYFSKVFQVISQMLFSLKADRIADQAIKRLKEGKKPVIAFASTMESFLEQMTNERGHRISPGDNISTDFSIVLERGLEGIFRYSVLDAEGQSQKRQFTRHEMSESAQAAHEKLHNAIRAVSTGLTVSPIDVIIQRIEQAGYSVAEVTGRRLRLELDRTQNRGTVLLRRKINTNDAFRQFNDNEVDVLLINQSGSTGGSAHALVTPRVPKELVKPRVMIIGQAEPDINQEVQKRGRIMRTGQIHLPEYDYISSKVPAEARPLMMLQVKLRSLDANTSGNQKQSTNILDFPDFLNKYGDQVVLDYLIENPEINRQLGDPGNLIGKKSSRPEKHGLAWKTTGRVAVLSSEQQNTFYREIGAAYNELVAYLRQTDEYDLEVQTLNLEAETQSSKLVIAGKNTDSAFGGHSFLERVSAKVLRKPYARVQLENLLQDALGGRKPHSIQRELIEEFRTGAKNVLAARIEQVHAHYDRLVEEAPESKRVANAIEKATKKSGAGAGAQAGRAELEAMLADLKTARASRIKSEENRTNSMVREIAAQMEFLYPGRSLKYETVRTQEFTQYVQAVCIGWQIDRKRQNPYVPSAIKVRIAISNSMKHLAIPASQSPKIQQLIQSSSEGKEQNMPSVLSEWEQEIRKNTAEREVRYIATGNLLQAYPQFPAKLVSYTTKAGDTRKGLLLPRGWEPWKELRAGETIVPIGFALLVLKGLAKGKSLSIEHISIGRHADGYVMVVPANKQKGGKFFLDETLIRLSSEGTFNKRSGNMVANFKQSRLNALVKHLDEHHRLVVQLSKAQAARIKHLLNTRKGELPSLSLHRPRAGRHGKQQQDKQLELARARAKAIIIIQEQRKRKRLAEAS